MTMSECCHASIGSKTPTGVRRPHGALRWLLPGAILALMPKCPVCLAAYGSLWFGLGLSMATAAVLRWALIVLCVAWLLFLIFKRIGRFAAASNHFRKGTKSCETKS
jgi:hypothetical protein